MARDEVANYSIDALFSSTSVGSLDKAIGLNGYGFNFQQAPTMVPRNREQPGFVFFTRPQLCLQRDNIANERMMYSLLTANPLSKERYIACMLDPRLAAGYNYLNASAPIVTSPLVDAENAFIPILSNNLMTLTGWPEQTMTFQKSKEDVYRGVHSQAQGISFNNGSYTLSATFRNTAGNPIIAMMHYWLTYMSCVTVTGTLRPYADMEAMDYMDYNTRITHVTLDAQAEYVTGIYATGAATPSSNAIAQFADYNRATPIVDTNKDFTISFECDGFIINDPILYRSFNGVVSAFCVGMSDYYRDTFMVRVSKTERNYFRNICYPRIDPATAAFEIWVPKDLYAKRMTALGMLPEEIEPTGLDFSEASKSTTPNPSFVWGA